MIKCCFCRETIAFSFKFFMYGESLVVASVDVQKKASVRSLSRSDLSDATSGDTVQGTIFMPNSDSFQYHAASEYSFAALVSHHLQIPPHSFLSCNVLPHNHSQCTLQ